MHYRLLCLLSTLLPILLSGQGSPLPLGNEAYPILDRLEIFTGVAPAYHSSLKPYLRGDAAAYALTLDTMQSMPFGVKNRRDLYYLFRDNNEWLAQPAFPTRLGSRREAPAGEPGLTQIEASMENARYTLSKKPILKYFYQTPANLFEVNEKYFHFRLNPLINFSLANARDDKQPVFYNIRGIEARGGVDDRIYFYFNILESQARFPNYVNQRIDRELAIPGAGFFKVYKSEIFDIERGYDFLNGQGFVGFNFTRHVGAQFGYGRNFIGNGYRSLILSDFSNNYLYLKLNWRVWKFHYQNLFAELSAASAASISGDDVPLPKKYMASHHLSFNITPNLNIGLVETVLFSRNNQLEFHYLLPIMFYRALEQGLNSPDNVLIGVDAKWNLLRRFQLYGQLMMDEFKFDELFLERRGWWGNKFGVQAGLKYINVLGIDHLDLQVEYNTVRPYTYTHRDSSATFTHYNQPMAHPLGANFREGIVRVRYQPFKRVTAEGRLITARYGDDGPGQNFGGDLLLSSSSRQAEYGNETGQGIDTRLLLYGIDLSYRLAHNVFADLQYFYRRRNSADDSRDLDTQYFGGGIRVNLARVNMDF